MFDLQTHDHQHTDLASLLIPCIPPDAFNYQQQVSYLNPDEDQLGLWALVESMPLLQRN